MKTYCGQILDAFNFFTYKSHHPVIWLTVRFEGCNLNFNCITTATASSSQSGAYPNEPPGHQNICVCSAHFMSS